MDMFGTWLTATDEEVAAALKAARTTTDDDVDYTEHDWEDASAEDAYEAASHPVEQHEHHHVSEER